jgi:hypothetical protein
MMEAITKPELEYYLGWCKHVGVEPVSRMVTSDDGEKVFKTTLRNTDVVQGKNKEGCATVGGCTIDQSIINLFRHLKGKAVKTPLGKFNTPYYMAGVQ